MNAVLLDLVATGAIISGLLVITAKSPVSSVLFLISTFVMSACYLVLLGIGFVGLSYLIVYVGAIAMLFLFVVMMMNLQLVELIEVGREYTQNLPLGLIVGATLFFELISVLPVSLAETASQNRLLGLYTSLQQAIFGVSQSGHANGAAETVHQAFSSAAVDSTVLEFTNLEAIGHGLYTYGAVWLILGSILLLLGMVGPIALCLDQVSHTTPESEFHN